MTDNKEQELAIINKKGQLSIKLAEECFVNFEGRDVYFLARACLESLEKYELANIILENIPNIMTEKSKLKLDEFSANLLWEQIEAEDK